jgi:diguanylate cyclase (GGDEF)-like protein/PAS domain S-box-containing protein
MLNYFAEFRSGKKEWHIAARTLFANGEAFAVYPGPAAILRHDGSVIIANAEARKLADQLHLEPGGRLEPALAGAIRAGFSTSVPVTVTDLDPETGGVQVKTLEFTVLPVVPMETALVFGRDTTLETAFRGALADSRKRYKDLVDLCSDFCWETDADGRFSFVSSGGILDYPIEELIGTVAASFYISGQEDRGESPFTSKTVVDQVDVWLRRANGARVCLETSSRPVTDPAGAFQGARGVCRDVTVERNRQSELSRVHVREQLTAHVMRTIRDEGVPENMLAAAAQAVAPAVGASGCTIMKIDDEGGLARAATYGAGSPPDEVIAAVLLRAPADGRVFTAEDDGHALLCVSTSCQHDVNGALVLWRDKDRGEWSADDCTVISDVAVQLGVALQQIHIRIELESLSRTDPLTGLLNRRAFSAELEDRMDRVRRGNTDGALFYIDLDNFKPVNDILGHQKGDEALKAVAELLVRATRPGDLVARLGGDEFALWLDRTDEQTAEGRARALLDGVDCLKAWSVSTDRPLGYSIGITICRAGSTENAEALSARADQAMYSVKKNGKAGFEIAASVPEENFNRDQAVSA